MKNKSLWIALVVVAIIAIAGLSSPKVQQALGADPSPVKTVAQELNGGLSQGFVISTTTTVATYTMVAADLAPSKQGALYDTVLFTKTVGVSGGGNLSTTTLTFPASSSLPYVIPKAGMRARQCWVSATSSPAKLGFILAAGTGFDFKSSSTTPTDLTVEGGGVACLDFIRQADSDITVLITDWQESD